jgi:uncharacterized protein (DUF885 family)
MRRLSSACLLSATLAVMAQTPSRMPDRVRRVEADLGSLERFYSIPEGEARQARFKAFYQSELSALAALDREPLGMEDRIDVLLLRQKMAYGLHQLEEEQTRMKELAPLLPFASALRKLAEDRRLMTPQDPKACAAWLAGFHSDIQALLDGKLEGLKPSPLQAQRAARTVRALQKDLESWQRFYMGYDPLFTWWCERPVKALEASLESYHKALDRLGGVKDKDQIVGDPIGRDALQAALKAQFIAYSPDEILELGRREMAWCQVEMKKAAKDMGFGEDWRAALEKVKNAYVAPGGQPAQIKALAEEAIRYLEEKDLVTIPPLAKETWRMEMLSPEAQKVSPFFLGGEMIQVAYPTDSMEQDEKLMSLRGNNTAFARATVHHELIPGHHLQLFMGDRFQSHREAFSTPFLVEGWALYWEMLLWDLGFPRTPEERLGMLVWRQHRCARIFFSFGFHLGQMTPQQCVDLLVDTVGFERANAAAEVRRSLQGGYGPLYQAAYMVGGQQLRALNKELVGGGRMTLKAFHDAVLQSGPIPIELIRFRLKGEVPPANHAPSWRFYPSDLKLSASR